MATRRVKSLKKPGRVSVTKARAYVLEMQAAGAARSSTTKGGAKKGAASKSASTRGAEKKGVATKGVATKGAAAKAPAATKAARPKKLTRADTATGRGLVTFHVAP